MINTIVKVFRGIAKLRGASDNTLIGNTGDRLKTESAIPSLVTEAIPSLTNLLSYDDMNINTGGVARNTIISDTIPSTVYLYTGSGLLFGFLSTLEKIDDGWEVDLIVDGVNILGPMGINTKDMDRDKIYAFDVNKNINDPWLGLDIQKETFRWKSPMNIPLKFKTSIEIKVKRVSGQGPKKFKAGLVTIYKEA